MLAKTLEINKKKKRISNSKKFSIISYGCQMNVSDSEVVAFDRFYAQNLGVNIDDLIISQPDHGEQALEIQLSNNKLINRAERILMKELSIDNDKAKSLLEENKSVRKSIENNK